jgi:hypothetical protein
MLASEAEERANFAQIVVCLEKMLNFYSNFTPQKDASLVNYSVRDSSYDPTNMLKS